MYIYYIDFECGLSLMFHTAVQSSLHINEHGGFAQVMKGDLHTC